MMEDENKFIAISALIGEQTRARMLWNLLDGRAYTASELAHVADVSATSASNHLSKLLEAGLLKVEIQGRHRYYSFAKPEVAYVVESLASLTDRNKRKTKEYKAEISGIKFCRTCYDHLAGYVGVRITEGLEAKGLIQKSGTVYDVTDKGRRWLTSFDISKNEIADKRRILARQCLDWSERRPHLAGLLGALLLEKMLERRWFKRVQFSRELIVTPKGRNEIYVFLAVEISPS